MKVKYRGFELEAKREECLAGYDLLYYTICDEHNKEWDCGFEDSEELESTKIEDLKVWVDEFYKQIRKSICLECQEKLAPTMNNNLYCENCEEYYEKG